MKLSRARDILLQVIKTQYGPDVMAEAITFACDEFMRRTGIGMTSGSVTLSSGVATINIAATLTDFRPERFDQAYITTAGSHQYEFILPRSFETVARQHQHGSVSDAPRVIGWLTATNGLVYPTPDQAYAIQVAYRQPAVDRRSGADPTLNVPDEYIRGVLWYGASAALEINNESAAFHSEAWARFLAYCDEVRGKGSPDIGVVEPDSREYI